MFRYIQRTALLLFVFLVVATQGFGQNSNRKYKSYHQNVGEIIVTVSDGYYKIVPYSKKAFQLTFYPAGKPINNISFAVSGSPEKTDYRIYDEPNQVKIESAGIKILVNKEPFNLAFYRNNELLFSENQGYVLTDSSQIMNFKIDDAEALFGGGARVLGMNRRGNYLEMYNKAHYGYETRSELMNYTLPMYLSSKKYMVVFDNCSLGWLDLDSKKNNTVQYEASAGAITYFVIAGNNWFELTEQYTNVTGKQPLPSRWVFGNYSSRFGYHSQNEVEATINKYFTDNIPVEAVVIDIYWFGQGIFNEMGNLNWYRDSFPNPDKMIADLNKKGVKTILVTEPFILTTSDRWDEAVTNKVLATDSAGNPYTYDFYFGNTGLVDIFKPEARNWFWDIYKQFTQQGIGGWWGDLGEPEVHPKDLHHVNGKADEVHNAYGHEWANMIYSGYQKDFPQQRPFILMRSGFVGSQRFGVIPWSGDVSRSWGGLAGQPEIAMQMGMQGLAYMHSDLGGFADGKKIDNELYIRWLQYGVFQPIFRPHAQEHIPSEPVFQNDTVKNYAKDAIEMRYKTLPYIYSLAFENNQSGRPLMYPLFFIEPKNDKLYNYDKAYMWGNALLVSPVKQSGTKKQKVYLPAGSVWTDFYTNTIYNGGQEIEVPVSMDKIPVFARGGEFIPMLSEVKQTKDYSLSTFDMHFFADKSIVNSKYNLYNDDGNTPNAYEKGMYEILSFTATNSEELLKIAIERINGKKHNKMDENIIRLVVHNINSKPKKILVNSEKYPDKFEYSESAKTLVFTTNLKNYLKTIEISF